jgi:hypothetical protein
LLFGDDVHLLVKPTHSALVESTELEAMKLLKPTKAASCKGANEAFGSPNLPFLRLPVEVLSGNFPRLQLLQLWALQLFVRPMVAAKRVFSSRP